MESLGVFYKVEVETKTDLLQLLVREDDLAELGLSLNDNIARMGYWRFAGLSLEDQLPVIFFIPLDQIELVKCKMLTPVSNSIPSA